MITRAGEAEERSKKALVTAHHLELGGARWADHAWQFPDESRGVFTKNVALTARADGKRSSASAVHRIAADAPSLIGAHIGKVSGHAIMRA